MRDKLPNREYINSIYALLDDEKTDVEQKLVELEKLYVMKPVTAVWYLARARLLWQKEKKRSAGYDEIKDKIYFWHKDEAILQVLSFYRELDLAGKDIGMADYRRFIIWQLEDEKEEIQKVLLSVKKQEKNVLECFASLRSLAALYLTCGKILNYYILMLYEEFTGKREIPRRPWILNSSNFGYMKEYIKAHGTVVITVNTPDSQNEAFILGYCMSQMGCAVYILNIPTKIEVDALIALEDTISVSIENAEVFYGFTLVPAVELVMQGKSFGNNTANIINAICGEDKTVLVLSSSRKFEELSKQSVLKNRIDNLYGYQESYRVDNYAFGWAGSYLSYIQQIYNMDVKEALYRQPVCRFSIVIPARNSAATLQHTLKTCLNQRWQGDFEVVISDNSTEGNQEVYRFCQTLQDNRVKYYRTPRDLRLNRSFEYAFLQTRGEYVLSIGSDDALLPWTLEVWNQVIADCPEEEVFLWDRGFYAWPGFNGGQQHQFSIPGKYRKGAYHTESIEPIQYLSWAMEKPAVMYALPMLYINSGFKRSFMQTLLRDTGRLWDGMCQDIYMGVIVSVIKGRIVKINYPLTIAGMSTGSVGAMSTLPMTDQAKSAVAAGRELKENNVGGFSRSQVETLAPENGSDVTSLYNSILRAVNRGLIPGHYLVDVFDWKTWFMNCYHAMNKADIYFDRKLHQMRFTAMKHGEEFLKWFDENIYAEALTPVVFIEPDKNKKTYQEFDNESGMNVDASRYGVHNSYEASLLFEKLSGL